MDDVHTHHADPVCSWAALCTFRTMARAHCSLRSNLDKLAVHSPNADLSFLPASVPGSPSRPVKGLKVMGAFISDDADWISSQLVSMVPKKLANLTGLPYLRDTAKNHTSAQGKLLLLRHCACAAPMHWLQLTPPQLASAAADAHDLCIRDAAVPIIAPHAASAAERCRALDRATLPIEGHGGLGLRSAAAHRHACYAGCFSSCWLTVCTLFPMLADIDLTAHSDPASPRALPSLVALRDSLDTLHSAHTITTSIYAGLDGHFYDHDTFGDETFQYHPPRLPSASSLNCLPC